MPLTNFPAKLLQQTHKAIALSAGLFIVVLALAGAGLVFRDELEPLFTPALRLAHPPGAAAADRYQRVLDAATAHVPGATRVEIRMPVRADRAAQVTLERADASAPRRLHVDPYDGKVVADGARQWLPFDTLFRLHKNFLLGGNGEYAAALLGAALIAMSTSGLAIWWTRGRPLRMRAPARTNRVAFCLDLHRSTGATAALLLLANALTGLVLIFSDPATALVNRVFAVADLPPPARAVPSATAAAKPLDDMVAAARRAFPSAIVTQVVVRDRGRPVVVRLRTGIENNRLGGNRVFVEPATGEVIGITAFATAAPGNRMYEWIYPLHTGEWFGTAHKIVLLLVGLAPAVLFVTGLVVWRMRSRRV
jgi:uncharacterized iron-regulated membrane protein